MCSKRASHSSTSSTGSSMAASLRSGEAALWPSATVRWSAGLVSSVPTSVIAHPPDEGSKRASLHSADLAGAAQNTPARRGLTVHYKPPSRGIQQDYQDDISVKPPQLPTLLTLRSGSVRVDFGDGPFPSSLSHG